MCIRIRTTNETLKSLKFRVTLPLEHVFICTQTISREGNSDKLPWDLGLRNGTARLESLSDSIWLAFSVAFPSPARYFPSTQARNSTHPTPILSTRQRAFPNSPWMHPLKENVLNLFDLNCLSGYLLNLSTFCLFTPCPNPFTPLPEGPLESQHLTLGMHLCSPNVLQSFETRCLCVCCSLHLACPSPFLSLWDSYPPF